MNSNFEMIRNAQVQARVLRGKGNAQKLAITIDGRFEHVFPEKSRESRMLSIMNLHTIETIFSGGNYFVAFNRLVDYRTSDYRGYIHSDDNMNHMADVIGAESLRAGNAALGAMERTRQHGKSGVFLGGEWDSFNMSVKSLGEGGEFLNKLIYKWSPFSSNVQASFEVERLVCLNGMVAQSPLVIYSVPLINGWEENLSIATSQVKVRVADVLTQRMGDMSKARASVGTLIKGISAISDRAGNLPEGSADRKRCNAVSDIMSLSGRNASGLVDANSSVLAQIDSHVSQFDLYNILTEVSSHTAGTENSDAEIQRIANRLVFDEIQSRSTIRNAVPLSGESDPRRAFFGK